MQREFRERLAAGPIVEKLAMPDALRERVLAVRPAQAVTEVSVLRDASPSYQVEGSKSG